jgi:peptidoglycan/LPS O-acetylase OafA/YrhL
MRGRIPSLDGLRGIAILLVLIGHGGSTFHLPAKLLPYLGNAEAGVRIFFALSGFLIYNLSQREIAKTGGFSMLQFYKRRTLRIFPCFYTFLIVAGVLAGCGVLLLTPQMIAAAGTFTLNYFNASQDMAEHTDFNAVGHYWTLALEEQFYLTWPLLIFFARKGYLHKLLVGVMIAAPVLRVATALYSHAHGNDAFAGKTVMMFHTGFDQIAAGVLLGELMQRARPRAFLMKLASNFFVVAAAALFLFVISPWLGERFGGKYILAAGISLEIACICLLIVFVVCVRTTAVFRLLNWRPLAFIGVLSYSLYVWNNLFLQIHGHWFNLFPYNYLMVAVMGLASHYLIENPFLRLKSRLEPKAATEPSLEIGA